MVPDRPVVTNAAGQPIEACSQVDPDIMFPDNDDAPGNDPDVVVAKVVCAGCGLRDLCGEAAMARRERFGIWGGMTFREREALRRRLSRRAKRMNLTVVVASAAPETRAQEWAEQLELFGVGVSA